ncbi:hypothetical protein MRX96_034801 [Rhipicephalus microplus]
MCWFCAAGVCDQRLSAVSSLVRSPGYPRAYPANLRCRYTVIRLNRNVCRLQVLFRRFSLENSFGCRKDYLEMPDRTRICGRYAGSRTYDFNQDSVNFYFTTDRFRTDTGFEIEIRQLQNSCLNPVAEPPPSSPGSCDRTVSRDVEIVRSPSFPGDYPGGARCVYRLRRSRPSVCQLRLDLVDFDVEDAPDCVADSLLIESTGERLCGFRSSTSRVLYFPREADELRLVFTSDLTTTRKGFEIKVTQSDIGCTRAPLGPAVGRPGGGSSSPTFIVDLRSAALRRRRAGEPAASVRVPGQFGLPLLDPPRQSERMPRTTHLRSIRRGRSEERTLPFRLPRDPGNALLRTPRWADDHCGLSPRTQLHRAEAAHGRCVRALRIPHRRQADLQWMRGISPCQEKIATR